MTKKNHLAEIKAMAIAAGRPDVLPEVKIPVRRKPRSKEISPREQPERALRYEVIKMLRKYKARVYRIENGLVGYRGLPDLLVFYKTKMIWIELKSMTGKLSVHQYRFQKLCLQTNVNHCVIRSIKELESLL